jgi:hypothetical protein
VVVHLAFFCHIHNRADRELPRGAHDARLYKKNERARWIFCWTVHFAMEQQKERERERERERKREREKERERERERERKRDFTLLWLLQSTCSLHGWGADPGTGVGTIGPGCLLVEAGERRDRGDTMEATGTTMLTIDISRFA